jgi:hypothetical protein
VSGEPQNNQMLLAKPRQFDTADFADDLGVIHVYLTSNQFERTYPGQEERK